MKTSKEFVQNFSKISIAKICRNLLIDKSNVSAGRTSKENYDKIKEEIENEIAKLYLKEQENVK